MLIERYFGLLVCVVLCSCSNFQYSPKERGVDFPLQNCNEQKLTLAREQLTIDKSLEFSENWVCVTAPIVGPADTGPEKERQEVAALDAPAERELRKFVEAPFVRHASGRPEFGIALAGGGSKASAFGTGVLAGLADEGMLDQANYVSTVSGGSYAAYFYYAHRIIPGQRPGIGSIPSSREIYRDCVRIPDRNAAPEDLRYRIQAAGGCDTWRLLPRGWTSEDGMPINRYQAFLRCQQDMFRPGVCSTQTTVRDAGMSGLAVLGTLTLFPLSNIANTLFDWGYGVSPSQRTYRNGIGVAFGSTLTAPAGLRPAEQGYRVGIKCHPEVRAIASGCDSEGVFVSPVGHELSFQELRAGLLKGKSSGHPMPFWIINAAAPRYRSMFGWWTQDSADSTNSDMFEMTAVSHGSGRFGYVSAPMSLHRMDVLDAVAASAAFLDSNQLVVGQPWRGMIGVGLHLANLDWGADIGNYNVSDSRRNFHKSMPFPFYYADSLYSKLSSRSLSGEDRTRSAFIRLMDGGNAENLGVYSLVKRGVKTILVSDAAEDFHGEFGDVCALSKRLEHAPKGFAKHLYIPGLEHFEEHCKKVSAGDSSYYDLRAWSFDFPVLMGCLRKDARPKDADQCSELGADDTRVLIVKPALHLERFIRRQTAAPSSQDLADPKGLRYRSLSNCRIPYSTADSTRALLNCDTATFLVVNWKDDHQACQIFPQHSTVFMTVDSSHNLFGAYRELARQYVQDAGALIRALTAADSREAGIARYGEIARMQFAERAKTASKKCDGRQRPGWASIGSQVAHAYP